MQLGYQSVEVHCDCKFLYVCEREGEYHSSVTFKDTDSHVLSCTAVAPRLLTSLVNATLTPGGSHMFVCTAVADPRPVFVFRFNGERITSSTSKFTVITNNTHGTLTVLNLEDGDEGSYTCSASNRYGSVSTSAVLTVQGVFGWGLGFVSVSKCKCVCVCVPV